MQKKFYAWLVVALLAVPAPGARTAEGITWHTDYATACQEAKRSNRPILIDVGAEWCTWCKKLDATTFRDAEVMKRISAGFVAFRLDADLQASLIQKFEVGSFPTLLVINPEGRVSARRSGYVNAAELKNWLAPWTTTESTPELSAPSLRCLVTIQRPASAPIQVPGECTEEECRRLEQYVVMAGLLKDRRPGQAREYLHKALAIHSGGHIREAIETQLRRLEERAKIDGSE